MCEDLDGNVNAKGAGFAQVTIKFWDKKSKKSYSRKSEVCVVNDIKPPFEKDLELDWGIYTREDLGPLEYEGVDISSVVNYKSEDGVLSYFINAEKKKAFDLQIVLMGDTLVFGTYHVKVRDVFPSSKIGIAKGTSKQLDARYHKVTSVRYESSNNAVATVDENGLVKATALGTTTIYLYLKGNKVDSCQIRVYDLAVKDILLKKGEVSESLKGESGIFSLKSSNPDVATVDANGRIEAVGVGTATIQCILTETCNNSVVSNVVKSYPVIVYDEVSLSKSKLLLHKNETMTLTANSNIDLSSVASWKSTNESVVTVNANGTVKGIGPGTANIQYVSKEGKVLAQCEVKVYGEVSFDKASVVLGVNKTYKNSLTTDGDYSDIGQYLSTDNSVVMVDDSGMITAVASGMATIKYVLKDDPTIVLDKYDVKVYENPALSKTSLTLKKGSSEQLTLSASVDLSSDVSYESENASIASVDDQGFVKGQALGETRILCKLKTDGSLLATCEVMVISENSSIEKVGNIFYEFLDNGEAIVTNAYGGKLPTGMNSFPQFYSGNISIPEQVYYNGVNYKVIAIGENAFYGQTSLLSVSTPNSVKTMGTSAFRDCTNLHTVQLSSSLTQISDVAFYGCRSLRNVSLPQSVQSIGKSAFRDCQALNNLSFGKDLRTIGNYAFHNSGLESADLSACPSLTSISPYAFANNVVLANVVLPANLSSIGNGAFDGDKSLSVVTFTTTTDNLNVGSNAFNGCSSLQKVAIADLKSWAHTNFVTPTANPLNVAHHLYLNGEELTTIELPQGTSKINNNAFYGLTNLRSLVIPSSVNQIGDNIFYGCTSLNDVYCHASTPPTYAGTADVSLMNSIFRNATLHVFNANAYKNEQKFWNRFTKVEVLIIPVTSIKLNETHLSLTAGETFQIVAEVLPTNATNKSIIWRSTDSNTATISATGLVTAVHKGTSLIYATSAENNKIVANCFVTVKADPSGINDVTASENEEEDLVVYRLDGTRVHDKHLSPGIYIINGRKVVVKRVK